MIIQHPAAAFLQKAFGDCIDADKELNNPEKPYPRAIVRTFNGHVQHEDGGTNVQEHTVKSILLPYFQQKIFLKEGENLFVRIQNNATVRFGTEEKCLSFEIKVASFAIADAAITASGNFNFVS
jgi:hypothetical protein